MAETLLVKPAPPNATPVTVAAARPSHALARRLDRQQCCSRGDGAAGRALNEPKGDELDRGLDEKDEADRDRSPEHGADQHRLAPVPVAEDPPDGAGNRHRQPGHAARGRRPEVEVMSLRHAEVPRDGDRKGWESEAETEDGGELGEPQRGQVSPPIDRVRWGHSSLSRAISRITGSGLE